MKNIIHLYIIAILIFASCESKKDLVKQEDYQSYLSQESNAKLQNINEQIEFWEAKEKVNPTSTYKFQLANLYSAKYKQDGNIENLKRAEFILEELNQNMTLNKAALYRSLAANAITQHEFKRAYDYASLASEIKDKQYASKLVLFDACMELAYYDQAEAILQELDDKESFDYQIRYAKWLDYKGDLDQAVELMETGLAKISPTNEDLRLWTLSNLGDMYGHQGKVDKAYQAYLSVLEIDPNYHYALKGIAYIAYAHDNNLAAAKEILNYLSEVHPVPDYDLMLADIADYEHDEERSKAYKSTFYNEVAQASYGNMYNKYIFDLDLEAERYEKAIALAEKEVEHRATPQTYDQLAWAYYQYGQKAKALEIAKKHVEGKTYEPDAMFHLGIMYQGLDYKKSTEYLEEAASAKFELGPATSREIEKSISSI